MQIRKLALLLSTLCAAGAALADITVGVSVSATGPAASLGIPEKNTFALLPQSIAGEKVKWIVLDDATDPTAGVKNVRKMISEDKADVLIAATATPVSMAILEVAFETKTAQIAMAPVPPAGEKSAWIFSTPQNFGLMATAIAEHMAASGVKSIGFIGYADPYGELWLKAMQGAADAKGIKVTAVERYQRNDTSVTGQALKIMAANPDAVLVAGSGTPAVLPQSTLVERGYKGKVYQTHAAATRDLMRIGGKDVEGTYVVSGPAVVGELLPDSHPSKPVAIDFVTKYEKAYGAGSRNQFAGHSYDALLVLEKVVPVALKKAKPGTPEFRAALKDAIENMGRMVFAHGIMNWTKDDHWGYTTRTGVILKVVNGDWAYEE